MILLCFHHQDVLVWHSHDLVGCCTALLDWHLRQPRPKIITSTLIFRNANIIYLCNETHFACFLSDFRHFPDSFNL